MKKIYKIFLLLVTATTLMACTKNENKQEEQLFDKIRDPEFRRYLLLVYDKDVDFTLSNSEVNVVTSMGVFSNTYKIKSFEGIEIFTYLNEVHFTHIIATTIDLSKNFKLNRVVITDSPYLETIYLPAALYGTIDPYVLAPTKVIYK